MARKKVISTALAAMLAVSSVWDGSPALYQSMFAKAQTAAQTEETEVIAESGEVDAADYGLRDNIQDGAILHCFDWKYSQIKEELPNIAEAGFTSVQTSPAQKGDGDTWYWLYQPQTFSVQSNALGTKAELQALCDEAEKYGIKVIVDVVANHTRSIGDDGLGGDCFHTDSGDIDYGPGSNRYDYTHKRIGMPDLNSESTTVQNKVKGYVQELKGMGVDGIRWDAAKHIGLPSEQCNFWPAVTGEGLYNYGEILNGPLNGYGNNDGLMAEYTKYISVTDDEYGEGILNTIIGGGVPGAIGRYSERGVSKDKLVYWAESHDTYANNGEYGKQTAYTDQNIIDRAYALVASQGKAASLYFSRPAEKRKESIKAGVKGSTHFTAKEVAAVNHLKNNCVGEKEYFVKGNDAAAICRESGATIVKSRGSGQVSIKNGGGLTKPGTYTDEVSGSTWTVTADTISGNVGESGIAVIYDGKPITKDPTVSVSKDSGTFTEPFELTLTPSNATKATYAINGGDAKEFTSKTTVKIGEGAEVGDKITVTVTAEGDGTPFSKTYTYTMADAPAIPDAKIYIRVKKSDVSGTPNLYLYTGGTGSKELNGKWPGKAMTEDGDYYVYYTNDADNALAIFSYGTDGSDQDPAPKEDGYKATGYMEYGGSGKGLTAFTPSTPKPKVTATPAPTDTPKPDDTPAPTPTATATQAVSTDAPTPEPTNSAWVSVSKENGSSFTTETLDVKLTLNGAEEGTYSVDNGPEKSFKSGDTATLGLGKIADTDVTLKVTAKVNGATRSNTFTYKKVFDGNTAEVKASAVKKIQNLFEAVADAAEVNAAAETKGFYATNPNGVGKEATITIDGSFSDWSEDMLIAQGAAWDIANNFKGGHENCVLDDYALYAAWDNDNLYIGWQMVNTTDTWAKQGDGPLSDGGRVLDVPLMLALNVGNRPAMTGKMANGKLIWDALDIGFETRVDNILLMSGKVGLGTPGFFIASDDKGGASYDPEYCLSFKTEGISYKMAEGCLPSKIMMLEGATDVSDVYDTSKYVDAKTKGHDTTYDSFYEINIPLKTLGIDKAYLEEHGIGVMQIATRGTSGIDCLLRDPSMLDNATGECAVDPSTSHEKDDADIITVPLAAVGNANGNGGEGGGLVSTVAPGKTTAPTPTAEVTTAPTATAVTEVTATPDVTTAPTPVTDATEAPTNVPDATTVPTLDHGKYTVNFGADRSSPQLSSTELTLKAVAYGGAGGYEYTFYVDDQIVKEASKEATCIWKGTAGSHTIKVVVADSTGKKISSEKKYVIEQDTAITPTAAPTATTDVNIGKATPTPNVPTETPKKTEEPVVTKAPEKTEEPKYSAPLNITLEAKVKSPRKAGTSIPLSIKAQGGQAPYTYEIKVTNSAGKTVTLLSSKTKNTVKWLPSKAGTYKITAKVADADGKYRSVSGKYTISSPLVVNSFKLSKTTIKKGKTVTFTAKATSIDTVKYQFRLQKIGSKKITTLRKYAKTTTYKWKGTKKGKYYIYLDVKDADGHKKTVKKKVTVK